MNFYYTETTSKWFYIHQDLRMKRTNTKQYEDCRFKTTENC